MESSIPASKFTIVPSQFFNPEKCAETLSEVAVPDSDEKVGYCRIPQYDAVLIYAAQSNVSGKDDALPEMFYILRDLQKCKEYNKIVCSWVDGNLFLAIAQGKSLQLANVFSASDFVTVEYYIFLALKSIPLNPEVSTICFRTPIDRDEEISLYRYFKSVEYLCE